MSTETIVKRAETVSIGDIIEVEDGFSLSHLVVERVERRTDSMGGVECDEYLLFDGVTPTGEQGEYTFDPSDDLDVVIVNNHRRSVA